LKTCCTIKLSNFVLKVQVTFQVVFCRETSGFSCFEQKGIKSGSGSGKSDYCFLFLLHNQLKTILNMKKQILLLLLIPALAAVAVPARILFHVDTYQVDVTGSRVEWVGEKIGGKHQGTVKLTSGVVTNDHGKLGGSFIMDMTTITSTDLEGEKKAKLEGHLKSDDFFGVQKFPTSSFEITGVTPRAGYVEGGPNFDVTGKLTIKGISNDATFPAMIKFEGSKMTAKVEMKVDRSKYDVRYGSKTFFPDIGDKAIADEFLLKIDVVASK
jgi:polyisoprenoid-binding protein YceI